MILVELHIENYKQFAGSQTIEFPTEGAVAVIGNNGVGKTTLFEAIEWCLYNPRQIPNDEIPPRGGVGDTRVRLTLEDPRDESRYVIERIRRRRGVDAEIYRADQPESPIVKGTRDVTEYVRQHLIGLSHRAFVSTFFTRQKELSFFGDLKETDRRREVAHLLGFETIRVAQSILGEERSDARADYQLATRQLEEEQAGRDLDAEVVAAESVIEVAIADEAEARLAAEQSEIAFREARSHLEHLRELERQDATFAQEIERIQGDHRAAEANRRHAIANLARLDNLEGDRRSLIPKQNAEAQLAQALLVHDANFERFHRLRSLQEVSSRGQQAINDAQLRAHAIVIQTDVAPLILDEWRWDERDDQQPEHALGRLIHVVDQLDAPAAARQSGDLAELFRGITKRNEDRQRVVTYQERLAHRRREIVDLLADGDPRARTEALHAERDAARQVEQSAASAVKQHRTRQEEVERAVRAIEAAAQQPECPTCHRPLSMDDAELAIAPLREQVRAISQLIDNAETDRREALRTIAQAEQHLKSEQDRLDKLISLEHSVKSGIEYVNEAEETAAGSAEDCLTRMQLLGRDVEPSREEVETTERQAAATQRVVNHRGSIASFLDQISKARAELETTASEIAAMGDVEYDQAEHEQARAALDDARSAMARIHQIDQELAQRPQYERDIATAIAASQAATAELVTVESQRTSLNFDRGRLDTAIVAERAATTRVRESDNAVSTARNTLQAACRDRDDLLAYRQRLEDIARKSEIRRREHDELDRMYREFNMFDQYVAQLVTPQLADYTGELLAEVTDRAYDQVLFDDNYGVRIFDGPDHFSIDQFSGGERDVAALCARLALSRFIAAQAAHPPRFLVLDEVFGSLDADRRSHVLNALLLLAGNDGPFRQLFIISHVDDVRNSPALDEVWRVREVDGASKVENISRSLSVEDL